VTATDLSAPLLGRLMTRSLSFALILSTFLLMSASAFAGSGQLMSFYGLGDLQQAGSFYSGGGIGGTPNYGVVFSSNFYGLVSYMNGGSGQYNPTILAYGVQPIAIPSALFICPGGPPLCGGSQTTGVMNVTPGFSTGLNFFYTALFTAGQTETVQIWSGANGTGTVLATITLNSNDTSCTTVMYCMWSSAGTTFTGTAHSVTFSGPPTQLGISMITLGSGSTAIPEPASFYLMGIGLVGVSVGKIRRLLSV
jgi:hypothetical protein